MSTAKPRSLLRIEYEKSAEAYLRSLPLEHFMEATAQGRQREVTMESLALVKVHRPDLHYFNELLVQYPFGKRQVIRKVVPDNMVVIHDEPIQANGSYDVPFQPVPPFWVMEYISKHNQRKDYDDSFKKYERELKVPYYLLFFPEAQELTLYRHTRRKYAAVKPNTAGRYPIRELEMELALLDGWVRFWFRGQLLPLPADLLRDLEAAQCEVREVRRQLQQALQQAEHERREKEKLLAQLRALGIEPEE
jgi:Uma2 family endonuclease